MRTMIRWSERARRSPFSWSSAFCLLLFGLALGLAFHAVQKASSTRGITPSARAGPRLFGIQQPESPYVGSETCKLCHEDLYTHFTRTAHFLTVSSPKYTDSEKGCEGCHGPGREHVEGGGDATKIFSFRGRSVSEQNARCLACHERQEERHNFRQSEHGLSQVACSDCHSSHAPMLLEDLLVKRVPDLCYGCHGNVRQEFARPFHHRVPEGGMSCTACHTPHGGFNVAQTREASGGTDSICLKCHTDKQGPFVFEHAPVKLEGCTACHVPHGSNNPRLLTRPTVHLLCLECHTETPGILGSEPPAFHDIRRPRFQSCTTCHVKIHGSNVNRFFFQ